MKAFDSPERLEDKPVFRSLPHPLAKLDRVTKVPAFDGVAPFGIVDTEHPRHRQTSAAKDSIEEQLVAERQPVLHRVEQAPEPVGGPFAVGQVIAFLLGRDAGIEETVLKVGSHAEQVVKVQG